MNEALTILFVGFMLIKWIICLLLAWKNKRSLLGKFFIFTLLTEVTFVAGNLLFR